MAPNNDLLEKLKSNLQEVRARGGELYVFADPESGIEPSEGVHVITMPRHVSYFQAPTVYTVPLQLLAYHVALLRGPSGASSRRSTISAPCRPTSTTCRP